MVVDVIAYDTVVVVEQSSHMDVEMGEVDVEVEMMRFGDVRMRVKKAGNHEKAPNIKHLQRFHPLATV